MNDPVFHQIKAIKFVMDSLYESMAKGRPQDSEGQELLSDCCFWPPLGELDGYGTGRCARCKESTTFRTRAEQEAEA